LLEPNKFSEIGLGNENAPFTDKDFKLIIPVEKSALFHNKIN